jgi:UPF0755 protein
MRRILAILAVLILLAAGAGAGVLWWTNRWLDTPLASLDKPVTFEVNQGATLRSIASELERRGLMGQPRVWVLWVRLTGRAGGLKAGEYQLQPGLTPRTLLALLSSGQVVLHSITFIEGSTFADMRKALAAHPAVRGDYAGRSPEEVMRALGEPAVHPEGQFFPDTYRFARGTSDLELLGLAHRRLKDELAAAWSARAGDLPLANAYEALILASIVEKETGLDRERPLIAGVFVERLRRGMRLQTDPTVIYGMMENYDGNIRKADLSRDTPYNTYTRSGLPPTPIAMPGLESIRAAARPEVNGAIFFVATGEPDGSHYFSKTLAEHEAAVRRYLVRLRRGS